MNDTIRAEVQRRRIQRLCHFTPSRNLMHIATDPSGILATAHLQANDRAVLNATDIERLDGYPDHVCCSIQYPNSWYFRRARNNERIFDDWVVLLIKPNYLWAAGTKFCPRNAAASFGGLVDEGEAAFNAMFATSVVGAYNTTYKRMTSHPSWLPTDEQAEVLIPDRVAHEDILGIAVADESQARREVARLTQLQAHVPLVLVAPSFFGSPQFLSSQLRSEPLPAETPYIPGRSR